MRCNRCASIFDHHCKFVNNCVGESNYSTFIKLIVSVQVYECFLIVIFVLVFTIRPDRFNITQIPILVALLKCILVFMSNGYLICFHIMLNLKKLTTFEYISMRFRMKQSVSPSNAEEQSLSMIKEKNESKF